MTKKLLVADDSVTIQKVVNLTFAGEDVAIEAVSSGDQALEKIRELRPDMVLADVFMPGLNGYEVCESVKGDPDLSGIPVVLLVGTFEPFDEAEAARVKSDGHLTKPFDTSELIQIVRSLLDKPARASAAAATTCVSAPEAAAARFEGGASESPLVSVRAQESFLGQARILDVFAPQMLAEFLAPPPLEETALTVEEPVTATPGPEPELAPAAKEEPSSSKPRLSVAPQVIPFPGTRQADTAEGVEFPEEILNLIVDRVIRRMSADVIREVAWEVIPELSEIIIRQILNEKGIAPAQPDGPAK
jgi:CheY-like chemotaxis protein